MAGFGVEELMVISYIRIIEIGFDIKTNLFESSEPMRGELVEAWVG